MEFSEEGKVVQKRERERLSTKWFEDSKNPLAKTIDCLLLEATKFTHPYNLFDNEKKKKKKKSKNDTKATMISLSLSFFYIYMYIFTVYGSMKNVKAHQKKKKKERKGNPEKGVVLVGKIT